MKKLAILDRDGTFIWEPEKPEGVDPRETFPLKGAEEVQFLPGAIEGMKKLREAGYTLVMATNQTFLGTEKHPQDVFDAVMNKIKNELAMHGLSFDFIMVCPHGPDDGCTCRKPAIGGLYPYMGTVEEGVDFQNSLMFGDRDTDRQFADNLKVRFVKIETNGPFVIPELF
ncbi:HAD-IIIA family hydrolase [Patescibacteria group bacterium]|nr:HAD-IIIA family hydrolase [Patescibacteria group bacterium]